MRDQEELKNAVRKAEESSELIVRYDVEREIARLEARLAELKSRQKKWMDPKEG
jgi:Ribonuclease G/E